ncbi:hypothetical protein LEN26_003710 [Aphanomyces euteiches]|nr:hypothetical protein LEN26_003710 [Aphanomyces euteiches]
MDCLANAHGYLEVILEKTLGWNIFMDESQRETMAISIAWELKQIQSNIQSAAAFLDVDLQVQVVGSVEDLVEDMHAMMDKIRRLEYYISRAREDGTLNRQVDNLMEMAIQLQRGLDFYHHNVSLRNLQSNCEFEESVIASLHQVVDAAKDTWRAQKSSRDLPLHEMMEAWMFSSQDIDYNPNNQSTFLGRGASANVYLGRYKGREVAVKHFHSIQVANSMELERSIRKEIKAWREVSTKPFILTLIGVCTKIATPILVCEYCPYTITQHVYMHPEQLIPMVYQLACGLLSLHEAGIIHRDLKGGNVLVTVQGTVAIADFGLSRSTESLLTQYSNTRQFVGTLNWMSPEQRFSPRKMTMQSDIWSFGMTVWQLLCDNIPYRDYSPEEIEEAIRTDDERPGRPEEMSNDNERLWDLITWCWRVDAKERPKASEVVGYLELHYAERLDVSITGKSVSMVMEPDSVERLSDEKLEHCSVIPLVTLSEWKIDSLEVKLVKRVDSEGFEVMWVGEYAKQQVMIKSRYQDMDAFTKEVSIMAMMKSPHVIALIGVNWTDKSDMKIIMEYMDEGDLQTYLQEHSADDYRWSDKIKHILGIALGLEHIHALGIVHGDFKSRNVLLDFLEGAQLTNFGMAHGVNELNV